MWHEKVISLLGCQPGDTGSNFNQSLYRKDTKPLCNSFMYSLVSLLSSIYPFLVMHSLVVATIDLQE